MLMCVTFQAIFAYQTQERCQECSGCDKHDNAIPRNLMHVDAWKSDSDAM